MKTLANPAGRAFPLPMVQAGLPGAAKRLAPGLALCLAVTAGAFALERVEAAVFGRAWIEALVLAILLGTAVRSFWTPSAQVAPGIHFSAKLLLEVAVVLLGLSVSVKALAAVGWPLLVAIVAVVAVAVSMGYLLGRALGLPVKMALLVACGNAICGNSAIAAVAPVIDAHSDDVATSIAFTAVLGVVVVLALPLVGDLLGLHAAAYGVLAGLTVYAVPQVLAASAPMGPLALHVGTIVKLARVLMLGPVCVVLSLVVPTDAERAAAGRGRPKIHHMVPWFILGFLALLGARSAGIVPEPLLAPAALTANLLTVVSMAALGLGVDVRTVAGAGGRVTAAVALSLLLLGGIALLTIRLTGFGG